ncbi:MAG TPA: ABC transporter permease [Stellaceae bacterium]|nr:ABC transporter permease [Stellaceae bacterium]
MARPGDAAGRRPWTLHRGNALLLVPPGLFLLVFFFWPLLRVMARSVIEPEFGFENYARVFGSGPYVRVLWQTIETAGIVTVLCLILAYPLAYAVARAEGTRLKLLMIFVLVPLWTSVVIRSYGWMIVFQRQGVLNDLLLSLGLTETRLTLLPGSLAVHVGMVHIMLPFMILPLIASMRGIDHSLLRAADVLGAPPHRRFLEVFLPLSLPGVSAGVALVFMTSLGFFITPALLGGPQLMMAAVLIEEKANVELDWPFASALATTLLLITTALYLVYLRLTRGASPLLGR